MNYLQIMAMFTLHISQTGDLYKVPMLNAMYEGYISPIQRDELVRLGVPLEDVNRNFKPMKWAGV